ncbi:OmpA family protein [Shewanella psychropiezotolerans]|uniref:OmpA family protein n=1 Tax=Shewanella psychropiezotolerans TaxID=2593655 RepID=A0ABX5WWW3_9GAMM|nr:OmpA family protein [Shewanella psychropiezotolerans]QDO83565.1 OmpA family protein [Shewanella psychropiezotolerans]
MKTLPIFMMILVLITACMQISSREIPEGSENQLLTIETKPTKAAIYKDGQYIGHSPLKIWLWHGAPRISQIIAVPLYKHQFVQLQSLSIPTIPTQLTFYMTEPSSYEYDFSDKPTQSKQEQQPSPHFTRLQLFFDFDQDQLNISEINRLTLWLSQFGSEPDRIEVHAYADETGSQQYNKALSHRRALAITQCLHRLALKPKELLVIHHGERVSLSQTQQLPKQIDRLVELLVFYQEHDSTGNNKKTPGLLNPGAFNN